MVFHSVSGASGFGVDSAILLNRLFLLFPLLAGVAEMFLFFFLPGSVEFFFPSCSGCRFSSGHGEISSKDFFSLGLGCWWFLGTSIQEVWLDLGFQLVREKKKTGELAKSCPHSITRPHDTRSVLEKSAPFSYFQCQVQGHLTRTKEDADRLFHVIHTSANEANFFLYVLCLLPFARTSH